MMFTVFPPSLPPSFTALHLSDRRAGLEEQRSSGFDRDVSEWLYQHELKANTVDLIRQIIIHGDLPEEEWRLAQLKQFVEGNQRPLSEIALNSDEVLTVRAQAARCLGSWFGETSPGLVDVFRDSHPMVRLGLLLGYADSKNWEAVQSFVSDPSEKVSSEAVELLEEVQ
jgi:hypothetical protein